MTSTFQNVFRLSTCLNLQHCLRHLSDFDVVSQLRWCRMSTIVLRTLCSWRYARHKQKQRLPQQECRHRIAAQTTTKNKSLSSSMYDTFVERRIASKSAISKNRADTEIASRAWRGQTRLNNTNNFVSFKLRSYCLLPSPGSGSRFLRDDKNVVTLHVVASKTKQIFRRQNKWDKQRCLPPKSLGVWTSSQKGAATKRVPWSKWHNVM